MRTRTTRNVATLFCLTLPLLLLSEPVAAESTSVWPGWRGPKGDGKTSETNLPTRWDQQQNVLWKLPMPGPAGATPVVAGDRIFVTSVAENGKDLLLLCADTSGKLLWTRKVGDGNEAVRGDEGNYASPSPSTDGEHVYAFMANGLLACYDMEGNEIWKKNMQDDYGAFDIQFGLSSTPLLDGDALYVQLIHGPWNEDPHTGFVVALDKRTGKEIWKHERKTNAIDECKHSYTSPVLYEDDQQRFLVTHGADYCIAHRLEDGSEIWRCGNLNPKDKYNKTLRFVASPACTPGLIVVPTAKKGKVIGIRPGGSGDITDSEEFVAWTLPRNTPDVPSPVIHDGMVYLCRENGNLMALDSDTGKLVYEERTTRDRHRSSPVYADGNLYLTARNGVVTVVRAGKDFEVIARNDIGEPITASPVFADGRLYLRTLKSLYAIGPQ